MGGCATYGCKEAPAVEKEAAPQQQTAWGDTKTCPACRETIKSIALRCRHCGTDFHTVDPLTVGDLSRQRRQESKTSGLKVGLVIIAVLSVLGLLAPIMLFVSLAVVIPNRDLLPKCGPLFAVIGWGAMGLSAFYTSLMLVFVVVG